MSKTVSYPPKLLNEYFWPQISIFFEISKNLIIKAFMEESLLRKRLSTIFYCYFGFLEIAHKQT